MTDGLSILEQLEAQRAEHVRMAQEHTKHAAGVEKVIAAMQELNSTAPATIAATQAATRRPLTFNSAKGSRGKKPKAARAKANGDRVIDPKWGKARELWDAGKSPAEIAEAIGVTATAVYQHRKADGWPARKAAGE